jgi:hypothetical protein
VSANHFTLLVEDLRALARALPPQHRFDAIERVIGRGRPSAIPAASANHLRCRLFDQAIPDPLPVAALTRAADTGRVPETGSWWLRADPVTLRPDRTQVYMVACGFGDADPDERRAIDRLVRDALQQAGLAPDAERNGRWCLPLDRPLDFEFTPLQTALGLDQAEALPESSSARRWKRLITEIQIELHQWQRGRGARTNATGINSVWFWGGGPMPAVGAAPFDAVVAEDPLTLGLAHATGTPIRGLEACAAIEGRVLVDWSPGTAGAAAAAEALDALVAELLGSGDVTLVAGEGAAWACDRAALRRFWKRTGPLRKILGEPPE